MWSNKKIVYTTVALVALLAVSVVGVSWASAHDTLATEPVPGQEGDEMAFLGITVRDTDNGVVIASVLSESPAADAELQRGDLVLTFNSAAVETADQLVELVGDQAPGDIVEITVERDGEEIAAEVTLGTRNDTSLREPGFRFEFEPGDIIDLMPGGRYQLGVQFRSLTPEIAEQEGLSVEEGAWITTVVEGSPAEDAGLQEGDIIVAVDGDAVDIEHTLADRLYAYEAEDQVTLTVVRDGEELEVSAVLAAGPIGRGLRLGQPNQGRGPRGMMPGRDGIHMGPLSDLEFDGMPFGPDGIHIMPFEEFDFEGMPMGMRLSISTEPPENLDDGEQAFVCERARGTFYVVVPDAVPNLPGCEIYEG